MFYYVGPCCSCGQFRFETGSCHSDLISIFIPVLSFPLCNILGEIFWNVEPWCSCGHPRFEPSSHNSSILFVPFSLSFVLLFMYYLYTHIMTSLSHGAHVDALGLSPACIISQLFPLLYIISFLTAKTKKMLLSVVPNMLTFTNWPMWIGADNGSYEFYGWHFCFYMTCLVAAMQIKAWSYSTS